MKNRLLPLFCAFFLFSALFSQAQGPPEPKVLESITYGGDKIDMAEDVIELHDSSQVMEGLSRPENVLY